MVTDNEREFFASHEIKVGVAHRALSRSIWKIRTMARCLLNDANFLGAARRLGMGNRYGELRSVV
jgi:hypothetical protein